MNEITIEKTPQHKLQQNLLKFRCPECLKLYEVKSSLILSPIPEFDCPNCHCHFGFDYPPMDASAILTYKIRPTEFEPQRHCPKCHFFQNEKNEICQSCGVVIENFLLIKNESYPKVSVDLIKHWNQVLNDFENVELHDQFIKKAYSRNHTDYALFKYNELKKNLGSISNNLKFENTNDNSDLSFQCDFWIRKIREQESLSLGALSGVFATAAQGVNKEVSTSNDLVFLNQLQGYLATHLKSESLKNIVLNLILSDKNKRAITKAVRFNYFDFFNQYFNVKKTIKYAPLVIGCSLVVLGILKYSMRNMLGLGISLIILFTVFHRRD